MQSRLNYPVAVLVTGFLVLVFLSLALFWANWICRSSLADLMPLDNRTVDIVPLGLLPGERENDPNIAFHSAARAQIMHPEASATLGIWDYLSNRIFEGRNAHVWYLSLFDDDPGWMYFDKRTGQIYCHWMEQQKRPDGTSVQRAAQLYVGPEGVSDVPDKKLGRFSSVFTNLEQHGSGALVFYDKDLRRFFSVDIERKTISKRPQLSRDDRHKPVDIGIVTKNRGMLDLYWQPPAEKKSQDEEERASYSPPPIIREGHRLYSPEQYLLVLDESGRIDLLDRNTLEFAGTAGHLPAPRALFPSEDHVTPNDLLAYRVIPVASREDHKYRGLIAAGVGREGTALMLAVFDANGLLIRSDESKVKEGRYRGASSSSAFFIGSPWAPVATICKYVLENLHPPILSVASHFTASAFEAGAGHRALFLLPNSFIAMKARDARPTVLERTLIAFLLMAPSILLALWLTWRVDQDAAVVGLSRNARRWWKLGILAFSLAGYVTYRLTRPKIALVTCANCGQARRPDMEKCHRCGSDWHVPELIPPAWRVLE